VFKEYVRSIVFGLEGKFKKIKVKKFFSHFWSPRAEGDSVIHQKPFEIVNNE